MSSNKLIFTLLFLLIVGSSKILVYGNDDQEKEKVFQAEDSNFSLSAEVSVSDNFVRLKHLTDRVFTNAEYKEILICKRPAKDKPLTLTKVYLENLFKTKGMDEKTLFLMDIPKEVKISYLEVKTENKNKVSAMNNQQENVKAEPFTEIDCSEVLLRVSSVIEQQLRKHEPQISIYQPLGNSNWKVKVPEDYDLKVLPGIIVKANSVTAKVGVYNKNVLVDTKLFNFKADIYINALVTNTNLDKGNVIKKGSFTMQLVPYSLNALSYIHDEKSLVGLELQKSIKAGEGVESNDLSTPILINRGASVSIVIKEEGFSIRAVGIAQESGRIGDQVLVLMRNNDLKIKCTVTGENTVDIIK